MQGSAATRLGWGTATDSGPRQSSFPESFLSRYEDHEASSQDGVRDLVQAVPYPCVVPFIPLTPALIPYLHPGICGGGFAVFGRLTQAESI